MRPPSLRILFAAAEAYPFAKAGGLGDVAGGLPRALARRGHDVRLVIPHYPRVGDGDLGGSVEVPLGQRTERVRFLRHGSYRGVSVFSVANGSHFERDRIYGYPDDDVRWILFSKAVAAFAAGSSWRPDVVHANDWHLGLVPQLLRSRVRTVLTVHNAGLQGPADPRHRELVGDRDGFRGTPLARGILHADRVNTVSRRYLQEILTPEHGMGLDGVLRSRGPDVSAILNGVDEEEFDPARDPRIETPYDGAALGRKAANKVALQRWSGLAEAATVPLLGVVARLVDQKGIDILLGAVDELAALGVQLVVAGVGEPSYRLGLEEAVRRHRGRVGYHGTDGEDAARRIYAGADLFLAPSSYEPCGLAPLIALRYGTIPVVRHTGGLAETIADVDRAPGSGLGFSFSDRDPGALVAAVRRAVATYRQTGRWQGLQRRAMAARFSWNEAAVGYEQLYRDVLSRPRAIPRRVPAASAPAAG